MKKLIFINGYAGVGKTTVSEQLHNRLNNSAWIQSEWCRSINPFLLTEEIEAITEKNMSALIRTYFESSFLEYVILTWGIHGRRKIVLDKVIQNLQDIKYQYIPITLLCDKDEHIRRMERDKRSENRIQRSLETRKLYESSNYRSIDTSNLTSEQTANTIIEFIKKGSNFDSNIEEGRTII